MFSKLSLLLLVVPSIRALTVGTPSGLTSGGSATITWTSATGDPSTFTLELLNEVFHNAFAIANNVDPSLNTITISLPVVPAGDGYTIQAVDIGNINNVYATSGSFSIGETATASSSTSSASTTSSGASTASTVSTTGKSSTTTVSTTTGFGTTATPATHTTTSTTGTGSTTGTSTTSTSTSTGTNAAVPLKFGLASSRVGAFAVALVTVVGGAVALVL